MEVILTDLHLKADNLRVVKSVFEQALQYCEEKKIKRILCLGDIFDSRKSQTLEILKDGFMDILDMFTSYGITLISIPGNHDKTSYHLHDSFLHIYRHHPNFVLIEDYYVFEEGDSLYHFLPFFSDEKYLELLRMNQHSISKTKKNILFTHIGITGATMNNGMKIEGISVSEFSNYDKVIVGHYHDEQYFSGTICYIGASLQHNFGENPKKGLTTLEKLKLETIQLKFPRYHKLETNVENLTQDRIDLILKEKEETGDNIKIVLTGPKEKIDVFNKKSLLLAGLTVEKKCDIIEKDEIKERVEPLNPVTLTSGFKKFCEERTLDEKTGIKYLEKTLN